MSAAADRIAFASEPRLHWENAVALDGLVLFGETLNLQQPGSGTRFIDRASTVLLQSDDAIDSPWHGDLTAFAQSAMDLYRIVPPDDGRRAQISAILDKQVAFAEHAIRVSPASGSPRSRWWIDGGYGTRFWQDDLYMVVPWLALYGSTQQTLPGNELARNLAYEWSESYLYDHRPASDDPRELAVPSAGARNGTLLWDEGNALLQHAPEMIGTTNSFWGRGNGWAVVGLMRAADFLDRPYSGGRYDTVVDAGDIRSILQAAAASLIAKRTPDGGWPSNLTEPAACPVAETSATALITFFLAHGLNEGWLDRETYAPVVARSFDLLMTRVDGDGNVTGIQPPGTGPACDKTASDNGAVNVNYGPGGILLAAAEMLKLSNDATMNFDDQERLLSVAGQ